MFDITTEDLRAVYDQLKDQYHLIWTTTAVLDEGFTIDCPIIVGKAHQHIIELYEDDGNFVLDVMDAEKTMGTHWHPDDAASAVNDIVKFMEGKAEYTLQPLKRQ